MRTALVFLAATLLAGHPQVRDGAERPKPASARLSGRVLAADTGKPLRRATVQVSLADLPAGPTLVARRTTWTTSTDADGRWDIEGLAAGRYEVIATRGGYIQLAYGQQRPFQRGTTLEIADGQTIEKIDISLPRASAISGRITDETGEPMTNAIVVAMRLRYVNGQRGLAPLAEGLQALTSGGLTNDLGQYRIHGLAPGTYYVFAAFGGEIMTRLQDEMRGAAAFYPGTASAGEAQPVVVSIGRDAEHVNFSIAERRTVSVSGLITSSSGRPANVFATLTRSSGPLVHGVERGTSTKADGAFTFVNVEPGEYVLQAVFATSATPEPELVSVPLTVAGDQDITGLTLVTYPGAFVSGTLIMEEGGPAEAGHYTSGAANAGQNIARADATSSGVKASAFSIRASGGAGGLTLPGASRVSVRDDGTFTFRALMGPNLLRLGSAPAGWVLKSIVLDGRDITDTPYDFKSGQKVTSLEVTVTRQAARLDGAVEDDRGRPIADYAVVAFSTDPARWGAETRFVRTAMPGRDGAFQIGGLPADEYFVIALDSLESGEETDRERLESWRSKATRVTLADRESKRVDLTLR